MNKHMREKELMRPEVTTGPLPASRKIYSAPEGHDAIRVPLRETALSDDNNFSVYDTSGPYTDPKAKVDVEKGLTTVRLAWITGQSGADIRRRISGAHAGSGACDLPQ